MTRSNDNRYYLEHRYQDSGWIVLATETFANSIDAIKRAEVLSRDAIFYGMVRVLDALSAPGGIPTVLFEFPAGHSPLVICSQYGEEPGCSHPGIPCITCPEMVAPEMPPSLAPLPTTQDQRVSRGIRIRSSKEAI